MTIIADLFKALGITNKEVLDRFYEISHDPNSTTVKRVGNSGLGGYLVRYGATDLDGERFTNKTQFGITDGEIVPVLFHHALFPEIGDIPIGHAKLRKSVWGIEIDPEGSSLWLDDEFNEEKFLNLVFAKRKQYLETLAHIGWEKMKSFARAVQKLIVSDAGMGWSSGCNPLTVKRNGSEIVVWEVEEASITYSPAEPSNDVFVKMIDAENFNSVKDVNADDRQQEISMSEQQLVADVQAVHRNDDEQIIELIEFAVGKAVAELRAEFQEAIKSLSTTVETKSTEGTTVSATVPDTLLSRYQQRVAKSAIGRDATAVVKSNTAYAKEEPKTSDAKSDDIAGLNAVQFALRAVAQRGVN